jgi:hypothetical protein
MQSNFLQDKGRKEVEAGTGEEDTSHKIKQEMLNECIQPLSLTQEPTYQKSNKKQKNNMDNEVIEIMDEDEEMTAVNLINQDIEMEQSKEGRYRATPSDQGNKKKEANLAGRKSSDKGNSKSNDMSTCKVQFVNPYINEEFKKAKEAAEMRRVNNIQDNKGGAYYSIRFNVKGYHGEDKPSFCADLQLYKDILQVILEKGKKIKPSFMIQSWTDDFVALKETEDIISQVTEDTKHRYLYSPKVYRGRSFFRKEIKAGMNNVFAIKVDTMEKCGLTSSKAFANDWNKNMEDGTNNYHQKRMVKENGDYYEINVMDITWRPIQEEKMEEVGYIYGSVPGQGMNEILREWEEDLKRIPRNIKLGSRWTQADIGKANVTLWKEAAKYDYKEKLLRAPLIQVIYTNENNQTVLRDIMTILSEKYGNHVMINTDTGEDYEMPRLPDGSRGIFIGGYQLQRTQKARDEITTLIKFHTKFRSSHAKWIRTNLKDESVMIAEEGVIMTLKEYFLSQRVAKGVFLYHQMIKRENYLGEQIIYLVCNNSFGQSATAKYRDIVEDVLERNPEVKDAFEEISIGAISAMTNNSGPHLKEPSSLSKDSYSATLARLIENERRRIDNVYVEGIRVKDMEEENQMSTPFNRRPKRNMKITIGGTQEEIEDLQTEEDPTEVTVPETIEDGDTVKDDHQSGISQGQGVEGQRSDNNSEGTEQWIEVKNKQNRKVYNTTGTTNNISIRRVQNMEINNTRIDGEQL